MTRGRRSTWTAAVPCLGLCLVLSGCWRDSRPDVVLLVLDAARADHLSAYGYARATTPHLDRLAAEGVLYRRAIAPGTWTVPSHASLFTARPSTAHGAHRVPGGANAASALGSEVETVAERLSAAGYDTAAFVGNHGYLDPRFGFARGFAHYQTDDVRPAERLARNVSRWLRRKAGRPFFLFMNVMDVHEPYRARPPYDRMFPGRLEVDPGDVTSRFATSGELPEPSVLAHCISQYDGDLRYVDEQLAQIFATLEDLGRWDNTLVVVTADHGEMFGEHGRLGHGGPPYHTVVWVPLIVRYPKGARRGVEEQPVSLIDVAPTILALVGLPPLAGGQGAPLWTPSRPVVAEEVMPGGEVHRAIYGDDGHVLLAVERDGTQQELALYDLGVDPTETSPMPPEQHAAGRALLSQLVAQVAATPRAARGPAVGLDERFRARLRALGYAD